MVEGHVHRWKMETPSVLTAGKCACGAERTFTGGMDYTLNLGTKSWSPRSTAAQVRASVKRGGELGGKATGAKHA